jgi:hypothetical protein
MTTTTTTPMARGYAITRTVDFIRSGYFTADVSKRIIDDLPPDVRQALSSIKPAGWYPREYMIPLMKGIANVKNDDVGSAHDLAAYGQSVATEATNTFLQILMKLMTPSLFAKKLPDFYQRDHKGSGRFEVDLQDINHKRFRVRLVGAEGFDHIGAASVGFFRFGIEAISGAGSVEIQQKGWSMATPAPTEVTYDLILK